MLNKIISAGFGSLAGFCLLLAVHINGFGQRQYIRDYEEIVGEYQQSSFNPRPANESEYQDTRIEEDSMFGNFKKEMREINIRRNENLLDAKRLCEKELTRISRNKCIESIDAGIQADAADYIEALKKIGKIYEYRVNKLTEQRKKFTPEQMIRTPPKRIYQRIFKDSIIFTPQKRVYERRKN